MAFAGTVDHTLPGESVLGQSACAVARLSGDLDVTTTAALRERLFGMLSPSVRLLIIDLSGVSFRDVAGLAVLIGTQRRAAAHRITVRLAAPGPQTARLLRITGLDRRLTIYPTLADALSGQTGRESGPGAGQSRGGLDDCGEDSLITRGRECEQRPAVTMDASCA